MKKYFAVYLPVEGEIKEHDMVFKDQKELATVIHIYPDGQAFHLEFSDNWTTTATYPKDRVKKAALHLVTRDINPGDKVIDWLNPGLETLTFKENVYSVDDLEKEHPVPIIILGHLENKEVHYVQHNIFKRIGVISKGATWVNQGDQFDDGTDNPYNIEVFPIHKHGENVGEIIYLNEDGDMLPKGEPPIYKIKCPTCKNFH